MMQVNQIIGQVQSFIFMNTWTEGIFFAIIAIAILKLLKVMFNIVVPLFIIALVLIFVMGYFGVNDTLRNAVGGAVHNVQGLATGAMHTASKMRKSLP